MRVAKNALILSMMEPSASVSLSEDDDKTPRLDMIAYSGGIIEDHYWWDNLALDLDGIKLDKKKYPILEEHMTSRKIAFTGKPIVEGNVRIDPDKTTFVSTDESAEFQKLSSEGFPYEASVHFVPLVIEHVLEGASAKVNGLTLKGPGTVFREWKLKEMSVATFGQDRDTHSEAFSDDSDMIEIDVDELGDIPSKHKQLTEDIDKMDLKQLKEKDPKLYAQIVEEGKTEAETAFSEERTTLTTERDGLATEVTDLKAKVAEGETALSASEKEAKEMGIRVVALEAKDEKRDAAALSGKADKVFDEMLSESKIPEKHYDRVKRGVKHEDHIKEGVFDEEAFSAAIVAEIKDWEGDGLTEEVLGASFAGNEDSTSLSAEDKVDDKMVDDMFDLSGAEAPQEEA